MDLGDNIKKRREELKLSQEYVAERLSVSRQAVSKWETGQSEPTAGNLVQLAEVLEISLSALVAPQKNNEEQAASEKKRYQKEPDPILWANLTKWAILCQSAFLHASAVHIRAYRRDPEDKVYVWLTLLDLILLLACSTWMTSNHRFEMDKVQRRRNVNIELGYCVIQAAVFLLDVHFGLGLVGAVLMIAVALVYILYINPRFMNRKLTK